jgi:hypothetical protein
MWRKRRGAYRRSVAKGELDAEYSYVTRWDADAKRAEVVAGKGARAVGTLKIAHPRLCGNMISL